MFADFTRYRLTMVKTLCVLSIASLALAKTTTDSQVMLQVANLKQHGALHTNLQNGVQSLQSRMESMIEQAVSTGTNPNLSQAAYDIMLGAIQQIEDELDKEKTANDKDYSDANNKIDECDTKLDNALSDQVQPWIDKSTKSGDAHKDCRAAEDNLNDDEFKKHTAMTGADDKATKAKPACLKSPKCSKLGASTAPTGETAAEKVQRELQNAKDVRDCLIKAREWSNGHEAAVAAANKAFDDAKKAANTKAPLCDDDQKQYESDFCDYRLILTTSCDNQQTCIDDAVKVRTAEKVRLEEKEKAEKLILKSCAKVRCYMEIIKDAGIIKREVGDAQRQPYSDPDALKTAYGNCQELDSDTNKLNIAWATDKVGKTCDDTPVGTFPVKGTDTEWYKEQYVPLAPKNQWMEEDSTNGDEKDPSYPRSGIEGVSEC